VKDDVRLIQRTNGVVDIEVGPEGNGFVLGHVEVTKLPNGATNYILKRRQLTADDFDGPDSTEKLN